MGLVLEMFSSGSIDVLWKTKIKRTLYTNNIMKVQKFCSSQSCCNCPITDLRSFQRTGVRPGW